MYTPTTDDVRSAYIEAYACTATYNGEAEWGAEFDRWLEAHDTEFVERLTNLRDLLRDARSEVEALEARYEPRRWETS
jgi:hypothetical protein